jgi:hypothetical protein
MEFSVGTGFGECQTGFQKEEGAGMKSGLATELTKLEAKLHEASIQLT